jgi:hypothetical protein
MSLDLSLRDQALKVTVHFDRRDDGGFQSGRRICLAFIFRIATRPALSMMSSRPSKACSRTCLASV